MTVSNRLCAWPTPKARHAEIVRAIDLCECEFVINTIDIVHDRASQNAESHSLTACEPQLMWMQFLKQRPRPPSAQGGKGS